MKLTTILRYGLLLYLFFFHTSLFAATFSDLKSALKAIFPTESHVYSKKVVLSHEQALAMNAFGEADFRKGDVFTIYYTKPPEGKTEKVAVEILEVLEKYQAMHRWVIGIKPDGSRISLSVLKLNDHYSYPLAEKRFLDRFPSRSTNHKDLDVSSIDVISGVTESSLLLRKSVKRVLYLINIAGLSL